MKRPIRLPEGSEVCVRGEAGGRVDLPAELDLLPLAGGKPIEGPARPKLSGSYLAFWRTIPAVVDTPFVGDPPVPENYYEARVSLRLRLTAPLDFHRAVMGGEDRITNAAVAGVFEDGVRQTLVKLARRYSVEEFLVGGACPVVRRDLETEIARQCRNRGLALVPGSLLVERIESERDARMATRLHRLILSEERLEQADRDARLAGVKRGSVHRRPAEAVTRALAEIDSFEELERAAERERERAPDDRVEAAPVRMHAAAERPSIRLVALSADAPARMLEARREWLTIGRSTACQVRLDSPRVSSLHLTVARVRGELFVVDHESRNGTWLAGRRIRQQVLADGDVLRIGRHWLLFRMDPEQVLESRDHEFYESIASSGGTLESDCSDPSAAAPREAVDGAVVRLVGPGFKTPWTDSRSIVLGSSPACQLRLAKGAAPFHAVVSWDGRGVSVHHLASGRGLLVNERPVERALLADGDLLEFGDNRVRVEFAGDVAARAAALRESPPRTAGLAVTCITGPGRGSTLTLRPRERPYVVGRGSPANLILRDDRISRQHARIRCEGDGFLLADLGSANGTVRNGHRLAEGEAKKLRLGDVVSLGEGDGACDLLVHQRG